MKFHSQWAVLLVLIVLVSLPSSAYVDPSGGMLFQILMPMLAALWGAWIIFAQRIRRGMSSMIRKLRGMEDQGPAS